MFRHLISKQAQVIGGGAMPSGTLESTLIISRARALASDAHQADSLPSLIQSNYSESYEQPTPESSKSTPTHISSGNSSCSTTIPDLAKCTNVTYEVRDGVHGVSYHQAATKETSWTPVVAKRKKHRIPHYVRRRFPPDHPIHRDHSESGDSDSGSDCNLDTIIPQSGAVNVHYNAIDGAPGLSVWTSNTRSWTPVAARTRARLKQ